MGEADRVQDRCTFQVLNGADMQGTTNNVRMRVLDDRAIAGKHQVNMDIRLKVISWHPTALFHSLSRGSIDCNKDARPGSDFSCFALVLSGVTGPGDECRFR